jgi:predicted transglutaminase-like cysteine proteinase
VILRREFLIAVVAIVSATISSVTISPVSASAVQVGAPGGPTGQVPSGGALDEGAFTAPPKAFLNFCERYVSQCVRAGSTRLVTLDKNRWPELLRVNLAVNRRIRPSADAADIDNWILGASRGACNDYAIEKRKQLLDLGWPSAALALTVVYTHSGEAHLVLTVRTDRGDYVLDNLRGAILPVDALGYEYVMRQSSVHPRLWVRVAGVSSSAAHQRRAAAQISDPNAARRDPRPEPALRDLDVVAAAARGE